MPKEGDPHRLQVYEKIGKQHKYSTLSIKNEALCAILAPGDRWRWSETSRTKEMQINNIESKIELLKKYRSTALIKHRWAELNVMRLLDIIMEMVCLKTPLAFIFITSLQICFQFFRQNTPTKDNSESDVLITSLPRIYNVSPVTHLTWHLTQARKRPSLRNAK